MNRLQIYNQSSESLFRLIGNDENALTFALGYIFHLRNDVLISFLKQINILPKQKGQNYKKLYSKYLVHLQQYNSDKSGIKDIVIEDLNNHSFKIIIEAKTDESLPSTDQLKKYTSRNINKDLKNFANKWIIILSRKNVPPAIMSKSVKRLSKNGINPVFITWSEILKTIYQLNPKNKNSFEDGLINELHKFIIMDYKIDYFEHEVVFIKVDKGKGYYSNICNQTGFGFYFRADKIKFIFPPCLYFLACYGPKRSSAKTGDYLRKIVFYDILSAKEILNSGDIDMVNAFRAHNQIFHDSKKPRIHVFKLGDKITVSQQKNKFSGPDFGYKNLSDFLV